MEWAKAPEVREQMVLFPQRLDDVIPLDHSVRLMDDILSRLDWSRWEAGYDRRRGQPPIPPRVIASIIAVWQPHADSQQSPTGRRAAGAAGFPVARGRPVGGPHHDQHLSSQPCGRVV